MSDKACAVPLDEQLRGIPIDARLTWTDTDGVKATHFVPIGRLVHEAADALTTRPVSGEVAKAAEIARLLNEHNTAGVIRAYVGDTTADAYEKAIALLQSLSVGGAQGAKCETCGGAASIRKEWGGGSYSTDPCTACNGTGTAAPSQADSGTVRRLSQAFDRASERLSAPPPTTQAETPDAPGIFGRTDLPQVMVYTAKILRGMKHHDWSMETHQMVMFGDHQRALDKAVAEAKQQPTAQAREAITHAEVCIMSLDRMKIRVDEQDVSILESAIATLRSLSANAGEVGDAWQPIETAPKDGTRIIIGWPGGGVRYAYWLDNSPTWSGWKVPSLELSLPLPSAPPTHWQPLPAPPKAGAR